MYRETGELGALEHRPSQVFPSFIGAFFDLYGRYPDSLIPVKEMKDYAEIFSFEPRAFFRTISAMEIAWRGLGETTEDDEDPEEG